MNSYDKFHTILSSILWVMAKNRTEIDQIMLRNMLWRFYRNIPCIVPDIILWYGSHLNIDTINSVKQSNAHLYCLPAHTTHVLKPLNVVIFHPIKFKFSKILQTLKLATLGWEQPTNCNKSNFTKVFKEPWEQTTVSLIKTGFRKYGIYPFNRNAVDNSRFTATVKLTNENETHSSPSSENEDGL